MSANATLLIAVGVLVATGVYLVLERGIVKMLIGIILIGNGVNLLILTLAGPSGHAPIVGVTSRLSDAAADPLAQAMILTAIVITLGLASFVLALAYRSYMLSRQDEVEDDPEDTKVLRRRSLADAPDRDRSDDPLTGEPSVGGDAFDSEGNPIPLEEITNLEDLEAYEDLHDGDFDGDIPDDIDRIVEDGSDVGAHVPDRDPPDGGTEPARGADRRTDGDSGNGNDGHGNAHDGEERR